MWNVVVFEHDKPSAEISNFFGKVWDGQLTTARACHFPKTLSCREDIIKETRGISAVGTEIDKILTLYGYGGAHHYTYGLCNHVPLPRVGEYLYIHIDHHSDSSPGYFESKYDRKARKSVKTGRYILGCGSFVEDIKNIGAKERLYIGTGKPWGVKYSPNWIDETSLKDGRSRNSAIKKALDATICNDAYISMDLDVLGHKEIETGFSRGNLTLEDLLKILDRIRQYKNIIGADILGYREKGSHLDRSRKPEHRYSYAISYLTYAIIACFLLEKDYYEIEKLRKDLMKVSAENKNGINFEEVTKTLKI